jgi:hypothetical protein
MAPFDRPPEQTPSNPPPRLLAHARVAYELGGVRLGLRLAWPVIPLVAVALGCCGPTWVSLALGVVLLVASVGLISVGGEAGRAVRPGLLAGSLCAALPIGMKLLHLCSVVGCRPLVQFCLYGGLLGGAVLGLQVGRLAAGSPRFFAVAGGIAALAGSLGCVLAGLAGVLGMLLGVLCASTPFLLAARAR